MASQPQSDANRYIWFIIIVAAPFIALISILTYAAVNAFTSSSIQLTPGDVIVFVGTGFTATSILTYVFFEIGKWMEDRKQNNVMRITMRMIIIIIISILVFLSGLSMAVTALYSVTGAEFYLKYALGLIVVSIDLDIIYFSFIVFDIVLVRMLSIAGITDQNIQYIPISFLIIYGSAYGSLLFILKLSYQTLLSKIINIINVFISFIILILLIAIFVSSKADSFSVSSQPLIIIAAIAAFCSIILITWLILGATLSIAGIPFYMEFLAISFLIWRYRPPRDKLKKDTLVILTGFVIMIIIAILLIHKLLPIPHVVNILFFIAIVFPHVMNILVIVWLNYYGTGAIIH